MEKVATIEQVLGTEALADVVHLRPEGELSSADLRAIAQACLRSAHEDRTRVVLDLSDVTHLDYRGVSALKAAQQFLSRVGGDLRLAAANPYVLAILRAAGAHGHFSFDATAEESAAALTYDPLGDA
jgi:anti-sigma B factor antagonist